MHKRAGLETAPAAILLIVMLVGVLFAVVFSSASANQPEAASSPTACATHNWLTNQIESSLGVLTSTCAQPALSDLSDYNAPKRVTVDTTPSTVQPNIVQSKACQATSGTSFTCVMGSNVATGNEIVVLQGASSAVVFSAPTDSLSQTYGLINAKSNTAVAQAYAAVLLTGGADTITIHTGVACVQCGAVVYEVHGGMQLNTISAIGGATSASFSTTSVGFQNHPAFFAIISSTASQTNFVAGANFLQDGTGNGFINAEHSVSGLTTSTTFPATDTPSVTWAEVGLFVQAENHIFDYALQANTNYVFTARIYTTLVSSATLLFALHHMTSTATLENICLVASATATSEASSCTPFFGTDISGGAAITTNNEPAIIFGNVNTGANTETLSIDFSNPAQTGTLTIKAGSFIQIWKSGN